MVKKDGGEFSAKVTDQCTHLVTTQKEANGNGTKSGYPPSLSYQNVMGVEISSICSFIGFVNSCVCLFSPRDLQTLHLIWGPYPFKSSDLSWLY
jgi:hypothetical protein